MRSLLALLLLDLYSVMEGVGKIDIYLKYNAPSRLTRGVVYFQAKNNTPMLKICAILIIFAQTN